ncbi:alpha/beta fold hydrolase [Mesorhizobium sp. INR15]|uniref:alpha/beta fold hydrolase n=1 Tax=Mesorhizobium sp. INR15 TaxID=2654248 RepID=UPI0018965E2E|nr:alpha/beta hydrolase [Mesorhizobium sp. INR15]QPC93791.1 alpha/beta fold hydrolase [Mesorhizobium sp. INR15]
MDALQDQEALTEQDAWPTRKRLVDVGGHDVAYVEISGAEPALLLLHGFTDTSRSYSLLAPHLAGRRLVIPDLRGHGASQPETGFCISDFAADIAGLIQRLRLDRPVAVGHSLGGMVAITLATRHPELISGLVMLASTLKPDFSPDHPMLAGIQALRDPISPTDPLYDWWHACLPVVPKAFLAGMARDASAMPAARWRAILEEVCRTDLTGAARTVRTRTLVIAGACDPLFGEAHQLVLLRALPEAILVHAQNCGHNPHWEDPELVAKSILQAFAA